MGITFTRLKYRNTKTDFLLHFSLRPKVSWDQVMFTVTAIFGLQLGGVGLFSTSLFLLKDPCCRAGVSFMRFFVVTHTMKIWMTT